MKKLRKTYSGSMDITVSDHIYLNIQNLKNGFYTLRIIDNNKVVLEATFKKGKMP